MRKKNEKNFLYTFFLCTIQFLLNGCASTNIEGIVKPNVKLSKYNNVLIFFNIDNYKYRNQLETEFQKQFSKNNIKSYKSLDFFSPLENYTETDFQKVLSDNYIEILLEVKILSTNAHDGSRSSFIMPIGRFFFGGGSSEVKVAIDFDISIYDIRSKETIFKGTATSEEEDDELSDCIKSIFKSLAREMIETYFVEYVK